MKLLKQFLLTFLICYPCSTIANTTYSIGTEDIEYYPHYGKFSQEGIKFEGIARNILDDFSLKNGISIKYVPQPIKRLYLSLLINKSIDFKYPDSPLWNVNNKAESINPIYYSKAIVSYFDGVFVHKDNAKYTLNQIKNLGVIRGFTPEPFIGMITNNDINLTEYSTSEYLLRALEAKRVEAVYINIAVAKYQIKSKSIKNLVFHKDLPSAKGTYHVSTIKYPQIIELIDRYILENSTFIQGQQDKFQLQ